MTAICVESGGGLTAKGLDISLAALQRHDPYIQNILDVASQVALYTYNNRTNAWEKTDVEGTLFIYTRLASPTHGFTIMNRLSMENLTEPITKDLDFQLQDPFLLYRNARLVIHGIWFYDKADCQRVARRMKTLTQLEQAVGHGDWLPSGEVAGGDQGEGQVVDIIQMLTKAHSQYDKEKSTSEPKEIGSSGVLFGKANLIKPIPVKPTTPERLDASKSKPFSLARLFGSPDQHSPKPDSSVLVTRKAPRLPVARTLTYDGPELLQTQRCGPGGCLGTLSESPENRLCSNGVPLDHQRLYHHHHQVDPIKTMLHSQPVCVAQCPHHQPVLVHSEQHPDTGEAAHVPCELSPHDLVHKLQLIQRQRNQVSMEPPRLSPALAPRFLGPASVVAASPKEALRIKAPSPQRIPTPESPMLLLSPSVFSQAKSDVAKADSPSDGSPQRESGVLTRSQLQATLLHLIQTDNSFLDAIYEAYVGQFC
ncbi:mRNA-decapping enzyme 1B isoform X2 [Stigmatopora argus]